MGVPKSFAKTKFNKVSSVAKVLGTIGSVAALTSFEPRAAFAAKSATPDEYQAALNDLYTVALVMKPTKKFFDAQEYDKARSDVKFCLDQLGLQKKVTTVIQNSIDYVDDPELIEAGISAAATLSNTAIQLDGTIYTLVFIPASEDGERPPNAAKYVNEANNYYSAFFSDLDKMLALGSEEQKNTAKKAAAEKVKTLPPKLFS